MPQESSNFTSLAQQVANKWMQNTPIFLAIREYILEITGHHPNPESIMSILAQAKRWVNEVVISSTDQSSTNQTIPRNLPTWEIEEIVPPLKKAA